MHDWQIMRCGYCGNRTCFHIRAEYSKTIDMLNVDNSVSANSETNTWYILECASCNGMSFYRGSELFDRESHSVMGTSGGVLYPQAGTGLMNLPTPVIRALEETVAVSFSSPRACAIMAGLTLEAMCDEEQVSGPNLATKLSKLAESGRIPHSLSQMAQQVRLLRNLGAHAADQDVTKEDVSIILDFVETILEYMYVIPYEYVSREVWVLVILPLPCGVDSGG